MRATWHGTVLAESGNTVVVEGNHYFPADSVNWEFLAETDKRTACPWKGTASYFTVTVDGEENENAAWTYFEPKEAAENIARHVAFWNGIEVAE